MKVHNPFRVAFVATLGVGLGLLLITSIQTLSTILLYVGTALFLSLGLDPVVGWLARRKLPRWAAVLITILGVLLAFAGIVLMVLPIIFDQMGQIIAAITEVVKGGTAVEDLQAWLQGIFPNVKMDEVFHAVQQWIQDNLANIGGSIGQGVITVGFTILAGLTGAFIILILTIYFTASTPSLKKSVYQLVPASKRPRFIDLAEQITDSVGYYVIGQLSAVPRGPGGDRVLLLDHSSRRHPDGLDDHRAHLPGTRLPRDRDHRGDLLPHLHADRGVRHLAAHHEPCGLRPRSRRRDRRPRRRRAAGPPRRPRRDPGRGEHPDHLPPGRHPATEREMRMSRDITPPRGVTPPRGRPIRPEAAGRRG